MNKSSLIEQALERRPAAGALRRALMVALAATLLVATGCADEQQSVGVQPSAESASEATASVQDRADADDAPDGTAESAAAEAEAEPEPADASSRRTAVVAGGCFWCVEPVFEQMEGVIEVTSGYAGGSADTANYDAVVTGETDHAEAVRVIYDPAVVSYEQLVRVHLLMHDPTQLNRQGPDVGPQYRSAIFFVDDEQKAIAQRVIDELEAAGEYEAPIVTTLEPLEGWDEFYEAEDYHQDFAEKNPDNPYIRSLALPKLEKMREKFPDEVR